MIIRTLPTLSLLLLAAITSPCNAQDIGRVSPASLPLPLPAAAPMPPDKLRADNPWNLPMTGTWRFALTHGAIVAGDVFKPTASSGSITASSNEEKNPPQNAFDGSLDTRWCASGNGYPEWIQADLGTPRRITAVSVNWENGGDHYQCRIEARTGKEPWKTLADTSASGSGDGPIPVTPATARYLRLTVLGTSGKGWASIREMQVRVSENGQDVVWQPPAVTQPADSPEARDAFARPGFDDSGWDDIPVPSNWEMLGYSVPTYNSVDNTVGLYRRVVTVPASWSGKRIYWHFDGALDGAEVFVNGQKAGYHESGYTAFVVDLTGLVKPGQKNLFAVRVSKTVPSYDCETGDFQAMGGIYRDTSLIAVPQTHVSDITVRTPLANNYKDATLETTVQVMGKPGQTVAVAGKMLRIDGTPTPYSLSGRGVVGADGTAQVAMSVPVKAPALWSAEKPSLYYVVMQMSAGGKPVERVEQRFGFRQIEIRNNIVLWNGVPIKCTGTCRHDFWADKGFALGEAQWEKDLAMMKAANINAIRTSHYNHAQRFLELCEEKGMYILDEIPYCWIGDSVKDPKYAAYLEQRAAETLARDKNRPCVLAWSIGNENAPGVASQMTLDLVKSLDPTRPRFVSCVNPNDIKGQSWDDEHYPWPDRVDSVAKEPKWGANFSEHPHIFYQKETQDYDPGASDLWSETLIKTWDKLWNAPTILGSFIWEWQNQGIADKNPDKTRDMWYGPNHLRQENNKGIVDAYRNPKPEWWVVKMAYAKAVFGTRTVVPSDGKCVVPITNRYSFTNLNELACRWTAFKDRSVLKSGVLRVDCPPLQSTQATFPAPVGMTTLRLEFDHPDGTSMVATNLAVDGMPPPAPPAALAAGSALTQQDGADTLSVSNDVQQITFDKHTGIVRSWRVHGRDIVTGGPILNLGEAKASDEKGFYRAPAPPVTQNAQVTGVPGTDGAVRVTTTSDVLKAVGGDKLGTLTCTYDIKPDAEIAMTWSLDWTAAKSKFWDEGVKFEVPETESDMRWLRDSYFTDYPAGHLGEPMGEAKAGDILFRASKRSLHWLTLTDASGVGIALLSDADQPLVGRGDTGAAGTLLLASHDVAGPYDFSGSWVSEHDIQSDKGKPLGGAFTLRAVGGQSVAISN